MIGDHQQNPWLHHQGGKDSPCRGSLRAKGQSKIEKLLEVEEFQAFTDTLLELTEREGFEPPLRLPADRISNAAPSATRTPLQRAPDYQQVLSIWQGDATYAGTVEAGWGTAVLAILPTQNQSCVYVERIIDCGTGVSSIFTDGTAVPQ